jgi:hypothetical protein
MTASRSAGQTDTSSAEESDFMDRDRTRGWEQHRPFFASAFKQT